MKRYLPEPTLTREEALQLWLSERSEYAKEQMALNNQYLVIFVLKEINCDPKDEDLFMYGMYGLCRAIKFYNSKIGVTFSTFAIPVIKHEILRTFQKKRIIPERSLDEPIKKCDDIYLKDTIPDKHNFEDKIISEISTDQYIDRAIKKLTTKQRKVIKLLSTGLTPDQIAKITGTTRQNICEITQRARKKMIRYE